MKEVISSVADKRLKIKEIAENSLILSASDGFGGNVMQRYLVYFVGPASGVAAENKENQHDFDIRCGLRYSLV